VIFGEFLKMQDYANLLGFSGRCRVLVEDTVVAVTDAVMVTTHGYWQGVLELGDSD